MGSFSTLVSLLIYLIPWVFDETTPLLPSLLGYCEMP